MQRSLIVLSVLGGLFLLQNTFNGGGWWGRQAQAQYDAEKFAPVSGLGEDPHQTLPVTDSPEDVRVRHAVRLAMEQDRQARIARHQRWIGEAKARGGVCEPMSTDWPEDGGITCSYPDNATKATGEHADGFKPVNIPN